MNKPLVTVGTAFYNTGPALLDMVRSIFAQTFTDWELILLDDGSTDNTLELARSIEDPRVRVYSNGRNLGRSASLNKITTLAGGKYIARMDSDDVCVTTRLEKQVELMESQPDMDVTGCGICYLDEHDNPLGHWVAPPRHEDICRAPSRTFGICHGSIMARKSWYQRNLYDETITLAIDFNILLRSYEHSRFANVPDPLYFYKLCPSFNLKKQYVARRNSALFLYRHFAAKRQYARAAAGLLAQYSKLGVTLAAFATGLKKKLMSRRFKQLSADERAFYLHEIEKIGAVQLRLKSASIPQG